MEGIKLQDGEEFVRLNDFDDYFISNKARVYSTKTHRFIGNKNKKTGYCTVTLSKGRKSATRYIAHLVMEYFGTEKPEGKYEIDHIDSNKDNNTIENLQWLTHQENLEKRNEYKQNRKKRLTKKDMETFNRWYIYHRDSLMHLSNEKVANKFEEETRIPIHSITVRANRDRWYIDDKDSLHKIPDDKLDEVEEILRKK